jgi:hypothetical protein
VDCRQAQFAVPGGSACLPKSVFDPGHARRRRPGRAYADSGPLSAKLTTQAEIINPDLLDFIKA